MAGLSALFHAVHDPEPVVHQCALDENLEEWINDRFWEELQVRLPQSAAESIEMVPSIEKSIAPLGSFVVGPMRHKRLFLGGDAAHIVPPTGATGLNLAASDIYHLSRALIAYYEDNMEELMDSYSQNCLQRVWKVGRFSWWLTNIMHRFLALRHTRVCEVNSRV